jgi:hypothetical protein
MLAMSRREKRATVKPSQKEMEERRTIPIRGIFFARIGG